MSICSYLLVAAFSTRRKLGRVWIICFSAVILSEERGISGGCFVDRWTSAWNYSIGDGPRYPPRRGRTHSAVFQRATLGPSLFIAGFFLLVGVLFRNNGHTRRHCTFAESAQLFKHAALFCLVSFAVNLSQPLFPVSSS